MALDSITLYHLVKELNLELIGTRIDKIHQPEKDEILIFLRINGRGIRLLLNASATTARLHYIDKNKIN
ncbi:MAG: NFACT family protein, partial [Eubacteriales bacterium]